MYHQLARRYIASLIPFLLLLLLSLHTHFTRAFTTYVALDPLERISLYEFAFTSNGHVSFNISSIFTTTTNDSMPPNTSRIGFVLAPVFSYKNDNFGFHDFYNITCLLDNPKVTILSTLSDTSSLSRTVSIKEPGSYKLAMSNCAQETYAWMTLRTETYNIDVNGQKNHLSDGLTQLPMMFSYLTVTYASLIIIWLLICFLNKPHVKKIHILMALLLVVKGLNSLFAAEHYYYIQVWGETSRRWDSWYGFAQFVKGLLFFVVIALIGTGWSWLRPSFKPGEKKVLMIGVPLQVLANITYNTLSQADHSSNNSLSLAVLTTGFLVVDLTCCCLIMLPVTWSINETFRSSTKMEGRAMAHLKRLKQFWNFSGLMCTYLVLKKVVIWMLYICTLQAYGSWWLNDACGEGLSLGLYIAIFFLFRPRMINEYFALSKNDEEEKLALEAIEAYWIASQPPNMNGKMITP